MYKLHTNQLQMKGQK